MPLLTNLLLLLNGSGVPTVPTGLTVTGLIGSYVANQTPAFTWNPVSGATYEIELSTTDSFTGTPTATGLSSPSYTSSSLSNLHFIYARVRARNTAGVSAWSAVFSVLVAAMAYQDEFTTPRANAAAIAGSLTEPGGQARFATDANGIESIVSDLLRFNGSLPQQSGYRSNAVLTRSAGLLHMFLIDSLATYNAFRMGLSTVGLTGSGLDFGISFSSTVLTGSYDGGSVNTQFTATGLKAVAINLFATGGMIYIYVNGAWITLAVVSTSTANLFLKIMAAAASATTLDTGLSAIRVAAQSDITQLTDVTIVKETPANNAEYTITADAIIKLNFTLPSPLAGNLNLELRKDVVGAGATWRNFLIDSSGNVKRELFINDVGQGANTQAAANFTAGQVVELTLHMFNQAIWPYKRVGGGAPTLIGSAGIGDTSNFVYNILKISADSAWLSGGGVIGELQVIPVNTTPASLDNLYTLGGGGLQLIKTTGSGDSLIEQPPYISGILKTLNATGKAFFDDQTRKIGVSGLDMYSAFHSPGGSSNDIIGKLATHPVKPDVCIINMGVNDMDVGFSHGYSNSAYFNVDGTGVIWGANADYFLDGHYSWSPNTLYVWPVAWYAQPGQPQTDWSILEGYQTAAIARARARTGMNIYLGPRQYDAWHASPSTMFGDWDISLNRGIHPNDTGAAAMATLLVPQIISLLGL